MSKPVYTHTNIPIHWTSNQSLSREWTLPLESNGMPQYPYNLASSRSIAFYANEYLLTANKHYELISTILCNYSWKSKRQDQLLIKNKAWGTLQRWNVERHIEIWYKWLCVNRKWGTSVPTEPNTNCYKIGV